MKKRKTKSEAKIGNKNASVSYRVQKHRIEELESENELLRETISAMEEVMNEIRALTR